MADGGAGKPLGSTGNAPLMRQGFTAQDSFGQNPQAMAKGNRTSRDLSPKG